MSREVFGHGHHVLGLQASHVLQGAVANLLFLFTERPNADHRIFGVNVYIGHGGKVHVNAHGAALLSDGCSQTVNQIRVSNGSQ